MVTKIIAINYRKCRRFLGHPLDRFLKWTAESGSISKQLEYMITRQRYCLSSEYEKSATVTCKKHNMGMNFVFRDLTFIVDKKN